MAGRTTNQRERNWLLEENATHQNLPAGWHPIFLGMYFFVEILTIFILVQLANHSHRTVGIFVVFLRFDVVSMGMVYIGKEL